MNMPKPKDKPFAIPKQLVWEAWRRVKANKGAPGVDGQDLDEFEADLENNLYKIWNRMSSGSYFPRRSGRSRSPSRTARGPGARRADDRGQGRANGRGHVLEPLVGPGSTPTPMATGREGRPMTRSRRAGSGAGSTTG